MAGHIQDRWYKTEPGPDGKEIRVKTDRYGKGMRYRARYISPDGTEKSKSFPDRQKRQAEDWLTNVEADMSRGQYIDPRAGNMTFQTYAKDWLDAQTSDLASRIVHERRLRLHTFPYMGSRPLIAIQPSHIRAWLATLESAGLADNYRRGIFDTVSLVLGAAVDDGRIPRNPCRTSSARRPKLPPSRVKPWSSERLFAVQDALSPRYRALVDVGGGLGLRQGGDLRPGGR
ncbi:hypothetical protein GCM10009838_19090 [Catenulispora subtropica]|uniref:Core-binding (CB) domain-containing protein n=1 Tax=Catenulispora subtropica TaxID=450798 RepID=A0ABN2R2F9_9ACTN